MHFEAHDVLFEGKQGIGSSIDASSQISPDLHQMLSICKQF